jgi:hypothetical protein
MSSKGSGVGDRIPLINSLFLIVCVSIGASVFLADVSPALEFNKSGLEVDDYVYINLII